MSSAPRGLRLMEMLPVLLLAAWARLAIFPRVLLGGVSPANGDSEYHLRRMLLAFESFPKVSVFDPLLGWPTGAAHPWAPGFDWAGALFLHLTFLREPASLALAAACFPVLLGLSCVWLVMDLAARLVPQSAHRLTPLAAGVLAALVPQFVATSRLGRTDHHVWEALSVLLLLRWVLGGLEGPRPARFEAFGLFAVLVTLTGFVGGPLYLALVSPLLLIRPLLDRQPALWGSGAPALLGGAALTALINAGPIAEHGRALSFGFPSLLQPALALGAACGIALAVLVGRRAPSLRVRLTLFLGGLTGLTAIGLFAPGLGREVRGGMVDWLWKKDPWLSGISEFQPLASLGRPPLEAILFYLGIAGLIAVPLLLVALGLQRERRRAVLSFALVFATLAALTALQMRFGRVLAPLLGVAAVLGFAALALRLGARTLPLVATVAVCCADPEVRKELVIADAREASPIESLADGLALERPPERGRADGVLASWELGDTLVGRARRPVIASGFGSYVDPEGFSLSGLAFTRGEPTLLEVMSKRDLGFVVTGASVLLKEAAGQQLLRRTASGVELDRAAFEARPIAVLIVGGSGVPGAAPHAEHLMPTEASLQHLQGPDWPVPLLWTYERVAGASVTVECGPGLLVAELDGWVGGQPFTWTAWAICGTDGRATLRLCVPTHIERRGFATAPAWRIAGRLLTVDEADIRSGRAW